MATVLGKKPVIAIVGATGTGKSQLAVELAKRYNGEIINSDAMQLYQGLPIITNKHPEEERAGIPHHLLGTISLEDEPWTAPKFVEHASKIIDQLHAKGKLPILVGGTHYYIQSLLLRETLSRNDGDEDGTEESDPHHETVLQSMENETTEALLARLREVDPVMADRWHPNNRRRIENSLGIYLRTGKPASRVYAEQALRKRALLPLSPSEDSEGPSTPAPLMRYNALILWAHASHSTLRARLDARVDKMLAAGLLSEVSTLHAYLASHPTVNLSAGIWVSIGYKEFSSYQRLLLTPSTPAPALAAAKHHAVLAVQASTRQYARRQIRWVRGKLLPALTEMGQRRRLFVLDGTELAAWEGAVQQPATELVGRFLDGDALPEPASLSAEAARMLTPDEAGAGDGLGPVARPTQWVRRTCELCGVTAVTEDAWVKHVKGGRHKRVVLARRKRAEKEEWEKGGSAQERCDGKREERLRARQREQSDMSVSTTPSDEGSGGRV